jgi:Pretoxin HINT domain
VLATIGDTTQILRLHIDEHTIRTSPEHPFFVKERGWRPARLIQPGDDVITESGIWARCQGAVLTADFAAVYNVEVAEHHTYFVGDATDGSAVWAHNACNNPYGSRGSPVHLARIGEAERLLNKAGWKTISGGVRRPTRAVLIPGGGRRFPDLVVGRAKEQIAVQVGRISAKGQAVTREVNALRDLLNTDRFRHVFFLGY